MDFTVRSTRMMSSVKFTPVTSSAASSSFFKICARVLQPSKRHASSYRRTRSRLNIKPDASFLPSKTEAHDHIIFNPPPSMPNVYHTPSLFLPKTDKRRQLQQTLSLPNAPTSTSRSPQGGSAGALAPAIHEPKEKRYHLTAADVLEMQELRIQDPMEWTVSKLAKKFDCSSHFVCNAIQGLAPEKAAQQRQITEIVKSRWGPKRRIAREDRAVRKERWLRDA